eukprot:403358344
MEPYIENILHLYDLPKEDITIIQIAKIIKQKAQYDIKEMPIIKRNAKSHFIPPWKTMTSKKLEDIFGSTLIDEFVTSAKSQSSLIIHPEVVQFKVCSYQKDKSEQIKTFGAIQIKNFPRSWTKQSIEKIFGQYGNIKKTVLISGRGLLSEKDPVVAFAFYDDSLNNQQGYTCAQNALQSEKGKLYDGIKLLVKLTNSQECLELIEKNKEYNLAQKNNRIALENLKKHTPQRQQNKDQYGINSEIQYGYNQLQNKNPKMMSMLRPPLISGYDQQRLYGYHQNYQSRQNYGMSQRGPRQFSSINGYENRNQQRFPRQPTLMNDQMLKQFIPVMKPPQTTLSSTIQILPPHILAYNQTGMAKILPLVSPLNPNYKSQVGEYIYEHAEQLAGEEFAPKITGMLIDLPITEIQAYVTDFMKLQIKINEAFQLLKSQQQK